MSDTAPAYDVVSAIIKYETSDSITVDEVLELFQHLVNTGMAWTLQGHYGRTASRLIEDGHIKPKEAK